jgi:hypothetical protein
MRDGQIRLTQHELVYEGERADRPLHYHSKRSTGEHSLTCCCLRVLCCLALAGMSRFVVSVLGVPEVEGSTT